MKHITVTISDISKRLDVFLSERTGITRSQVQRLIKDSYILVNNKKVNQGYRIKKDDAITIEKPEEKTDTLIDRKSVV